MTESGNKQKFYTTYFNLSTNKVSIGGRINLRVSYGHRQGVYDGDNEFSYVFLYTWI